MCATVQCACDAMIIYLSHLSRRAKVGYTLPVGSPTCKTRGIISRELADLLQEIITTFITLCCFIKS
jgi:hypothetical protein